MNTEQKFIEIFNEYDILNIHINSKLTKGALIYAFTRCIEYKEPLLKNLPYCDNKALSVGLKRAIKLNKPSGLNWAKYLLNCYFKDNNLINKKQNIKVSALDNRVEYDRQYYLLNKSKKLANSSKRKANRIKRTPKWANLEKIKEIYKNCPNGYHVDHIIPLQGNLVSGLHVENNLQYLTAYDNLVKGNKFKPQ